MGKNFIHASPVAGCDIMRRRHRRALMPTSRLTSTLTSNRIAAPVNRRRNRLRNTSTRPSCISEFYYDQFRPLSGPPRTVFYDRAIFAAAMGIGGCVRMRAYYDRGGAIPAKRLRPNLISIHLADRTCATSALGLGRNEPLPSAGLAATVKRWANISRISRPIFNGCETATPPGPQAARANFTASVATPPPVRIGPLRYLPTVDARVWNNKPFTADIL